MRFIILLALFFVSTSQFAVSQALDIARLPGKDELIYFNDRIESISSSVMYSLDSLRTLFLQGRGKMAPQEEVVYDNFNMEYYGHMFLVTNSDSVEREAICLFGGRAIMHADIGQYGNSGWRYLTHTGYEVPFEKRPYPFVRYGFPIRVPPGQTDTIYISVDETHAFRVMGFMMFRPDVLMAWKNSYYMAIGWIVGLISIFLLINFYLYFSLGEKINLWYGIYLFFALGFVVKFEGLEAEFLGLDSEWGFRLTPMTLFSNMGLAFLVKTFVAFVPTTYYWRTWRKAGNFIFHFIWISSSILYFGYAVKVFGIFPKVAYPILLLCTVSGMGFIAIISMAAIHKKVAGAWLFAIGISVVLIGSFFRVLLIDGDFDVMPPFLFEKGLALEALIISFALMHRYRVFRLQRNRLDLELKAKELETTQQLVETLEAEQERIARDLHDELSGNLAALQVHIHASALPLHEKIPIENILTEAAQSARQIAHNLMPPAIENIGLQQLLTSYFAQFLQNGYPHFHFFYSPDTPELEPRQSLMVYRIVLELVNNIITHSQATEASVQINFSQGHFRLAVEDNGTGMPVNTSGGMGLRNIRNRTTYLGGKVDIDSSGKGTSILISFPIDKKEIKNEENADNTGR